MARGFLKDVEVSIDANREGDFVDISVKFSAPGEKAVSWPVAYVLLIDTSKSMENFDKLRYAAEAAIRLIEAMGDDDVVAVYSFDEKVKEVIPLMSAPEAKKRVDKLRKLKVGSYTLLYEALNKAIQDLTSGRRAKGLESRFKKIVVITDGEPWPTYVEERWYEALGTAAFKLGITISAIGVGEDYNEKILYALSSNSGGTWYHINKLPRVEEVLIREMKRTKAVALQRPKISIEGGRAVEVRKIGATVAKLSPRNTVELEDVVAGEVVAVTFRLAEVGGPVKVVVEAEGERFETEVAPVEGVDKTATLTMQFAQQLEELASGGEVKIEVLRAFTETETLPQQWREKAQTIIEKVGKVDQKELMFEATTITYPIAQADALGETITRPTMTPPEPQPPAPAQCYLVNIETGAKMEIPPHAILGRQDLAPIAPPEVLKYISRRTESRAHLEVKVEEGKIYIRDAGSTGGVFIRGERIGQQYVEVEKGEVINLANALKIKIECS